MDDAMELADMIAQLRDELAGRWRPGTVRACASRRSGSNWS